MIHHSSRVPIPNLLDIMIVNVWDDFHRRQSTPGTAEYGTSNNHSKHVNRDDIYHKITIQQTLNAICRSHGSYSMRCFVILYFNDMIFNDMIFQCYDMLGYDMIQYALYL